jgi:hypothetical protein
MSLMNSPRSPRSRMPDIREPQNTREWGGYNNEYKRQFNQNNDDFDLNGNGELNGIFNIPQ